MNTTKQIFIGIVISMCISCSFNNDPINRDGLVIHIGDKLKDANELYYKNFIDTTYFIALKTPKEYGQPYITKASIVGNKIFTFDEMSTKRVNAYSMSGDFLFNFTTLGRSATEFINVTNYSIYEDELFATDPIQKRTLVFSTDDGRYIRTINHPFAALDLNKLSDNRYLFLLTDYNSDKKLDYLKHSVVITDSLFNVVVWAMPHPRADQLTQIKRSHWNSSDGNRFYSHYTETIYSYDIIKNCIEPVYSFDYGKYNMPAKNLLDIDSYMNYYDNNSVPRMTTESPVIVGRLIFANIKQSGIKYSIVCANGNTYATRVTKDNYTIDMPLNILGKTDDGSIISEVIIQNDDTSIDELKKYNIILDDQASNVLLISKLKKEYY